MTTVGSSAEMFYQGEQNGHIVKHAVAKVNYELARYISLAAFCPVS